MKNTILNSLIVLSAILLLSVSSSGAETKKVERDDKRIKANTESTTKNNTENTTVESNLKTSDTPESLAPSTKSANWNSMTMGGGKGSSSRFGLTSAVGQSLTGNGAGGGLILSSSFMQNFTSGPVSCCIGDRGNIDGDPNDIFDISDVVYLTNWLFNEGPGPVCKDEANVVIEDPDIADLVYFISYMFSGGPAPMACNESPVL